MTHYQDQCKQNELLQEKYSLLIDKLDKAEQLGQITKRDKTEAEDLEEAIQAKDEIKDLRK